MGASVTKRNGSETREVPPPPASQGLAPGTVAPAPSSLSVTLCLRRGGSCLGVWGWAGGRGT